MAIGETSEERKARLDKNESLILDWLESHDVEMKNIGDWHYLVEGVIDYWPRTGLFINRKTKRRGRGKKSLLLASQKAKRGER